MYVTTFYSFKGGVGRTLALVNVAVRLAQQGRRVLVVDFDLEAPGLDTFEIFSKSRTAPGIVDFVMHYMEHGETPDVRNYIVQCEMVKKSNNGALLLMPAGRNADSYGRRLAGIDWAGLYEEKHGYLMIEDMKAQWAQTIAPDYVLIDSRTGHTDESGICTRQLPDAVVVMFFPNDQNLFGARKVVADIRAEAKERNKDVALHFVTSNVPDLDDEDQILRQRLDRFRDQLKYDDVETIHHYPSLALLNQEIFVVERPRSRLAQEYLQLTEAIVEQNPEDKRGALALLRKLSESHSPRNKDELEALDAKLTRIVEKHPKDGEVATAVAQVHIHTGEIKKAKVLLDAAVADGYCRADVFRAYWQVTLLRGEADEAVNYLLRTLEADGAEQRDVMIAFGALSEQSPDRLFEALHSKAFKSLSVEARCAVATSLLDKPRAISVAEAIFHQIVSESAEQAYARVGLSLCFMQRKRFYDVLSLLGPRERLRGANVQVPDIFNFAMAEWAVYGNPPAELFSILIASVGVEAQDRQDANFFQCLAIAYWAVGKREQAKASLEKARAKVGSFLIPTFSAWRYLAVPPAEFTEDLDAIGELIDGKQIVPPFMAADPHAVQTLH